MSWRPSNRGIEADLGSVHRIVGYHHAKEESRVRVDFNDDGSASSRGVKTPHTEVALAVCESVNPQAKGFLFKGVECRVITCLSYR